MILDLGKDIFYRNTGIYGNTVCGKTPYTYNVLQGSKFYLLPFSPDVGLNDGSQMQEDRVTFREVGINTGLGEQMRNTL